MGQYINKITILLGLILGTITASQVQVNNAARRDIASYTAISENTRHEEHLPFTKDAISADDVRQKRIALLGLILSVNQVGNAMCRYIRDYIISRTCPQCVRAEANLRQVNKTTKDAISADAVRQQRIAELKVVDPHLTNTQALSCCKLEEVYGKLSDKAVLDFIHTFRAQRRYSIEECTDYYTSIKDHYSAPDVSIFRSALELQVAPEKYIDFYKLKLQHPDLRDDGIILGVIEDAPKFGISPAQYIEGAFQLDKACKFQLQLVINLILTKLKSSFSPEELKILEKMEQRVQNYDPISRVRVRDSSSSKQANFYLYNTNTQGSIHRITWNCNTGNIQGSIHLTGHNHFSLFFHSNGECVYTMSIDSQRYEGTIQSTLIHSPTEEVKSLSTDLPTTETPDFIPGWGVLDVVTLSPE